MVVAWSPDQPNEIKFVMVDTNGAELAGLTLSIEVSKPASAFVAAAGSWNEISDGWYRYVSTAGEADTIGTVAVKVTSAGAVQQNLEYVVDERVQQAVYYPYLVTEPPLGVGAPVVGAEVWVTSDLAGARTPAWRGVSNALGEAKDEEGDDPLLIPGTWYFWKFHPAFDDNDNPDTEVVT
jgi:hypothetical protein